MATLAASQPRLGARLHGLAYHWQVLAVVAVAMFMVVLDTTIVNIALPRIITIFGSSVDQAQLVLTGYMLALAVVMPATAYLAQRFGTKRMFLFTVMMFTLGSMLCGAAWSVPSLVGARVLQGLGGGMVQPLGMAMIFRVTPPERRGSIMGVFALPVMVAPILGPTLGGYLVEYVDWRWVFYLNVPVGALALLLGSALLRETPTQRGMPFDRIGFVLAALATAPALLALEDAPSKGFGDPWVALRLGLAGLSLAAFVWWELRTPRPLLNLRLFAIPAFAMGAVLNFVTSTALFGAIFLLPLFMQNLRGLGAMETGLLLFPQALASGVSAVVGGRLFDRIGARPLIVSGLLILATATWLLSRLDLNTPDATVRWLLVLRGSSMGLAMMPSMTLWLAAAPARDTQAASALSNVLRQVYGAFGTAAFATVLQNRIAFHYAAAAMLVTPGRPVVARMLGLGQQFALAHGLDLAQAKALTVAQLMGQARVAAAVRGFDDCFLLAAVACVCGIVPALFLRAAPRAAGPGHGPAAL